MMIHDCFRTKKVDAKKIVKIIKIIDDETVGMPAISCHGLVENDKNGMGD